MRHLSLTLPSKGLIAIKGPSGSGKSTFLNCLSLLEKPSEGTILFRGQRIEEFSEKQREDYRAFQCGFVYQHFNLLEEMSALENVMMPLLLRGERREAAALKARILFKRFKMEDLLEKKARMLSGGEKQRVALLRALVGEGTLLLADEPTGALDAYNEKRVMEALKEIAKHHLVVMVSHNERLIKAYAERVITLEGGERVGDSGGATTDQEPSLILKKRGSNRSWWKRIFLHNYQEDRLKNILCFVSGFLSYSALLLSFGFFVGSSSTLEEEKRASLQYLRASISETESFEIEGSPLKLSQAGRPSFGQLEASLVSLKGVRVEQDYSYFFPNYSAYSFEGTKKDPVAFAPVLEMSLSNRSYPFLKEGERVGNEDFRFVYVNEEFSSALGEDPLGKRIHLEKDVSVMVSDVNEEVHLAFDFWIAGVVHEFSFLNAPRVYYSYSALDLAMANHLLEKLTAARQEEVTIKSLVEQADSYSPYANYGYLLFSESESVADELKAYAKSLEKKADQLTIASEAYAVEDAFSSLSSAFEKSLIPFLAIEVAGVSFIIGSLAYSSFLERKKQAAILSSLGARKGELRSLYLSGSLLTSFLAALLALALAYPLEKAASLFLEKKVGIAGLIRIPMAIYGGIPGFPIWVLLAFSLVLALVGAGLPLAHAQKANLAEELRDE